MKDINGYTVVHTVPSDLYITRYYISSRCEGQRKLHRRVQWYPLTFKIPASTSLHREREREVYVLINLLSYRVTDMEFDFVHIQYDWSLSCGSNTF